LWQSTAENCCPSRGVFRTRRSESAFIAKLATLVPPPRTQLIRFHGFFAPNARLHAQLTPSVHGKEATADAHGDQRTPEERRRSMTWAQRLKRVFHLR
jgi:hypothetical protein